MAENFWINGEYTNVDLFDYALLLAISLIGIILHHLTSSLFVQIRLGGQNIHILEEGNQRNINWIEVESIIRIPFFSLHCTSLKERKRILPLYYSKKISYPSLLDN
ncbi:MAG: hypothetical protein OEW75_04920 [Cyclobacteriaceae bacterium]|nr:hypothetical protein [Cyclobacteriaceae bacterium]